MVFLKISGTGNEISAPVGELMRGGMRPRSFWLWHRRYLTCWLMRVQESARGLAQSKTLSRGMERWIVRQVLDCGGPPPLFVARKDQLSLRYHSGAIDDF